MPWKKTAIKIASTSFSVAELLSGLVLGCGGILKASAGSAHLSAYGDQFDIGKKLILPLPQSQRKGLASDLLHQTIFWEPSLGAPALPSLPRSLFPAYVKLAGFPEPLGWLL